MKRGKRTSNEVADTSSQWNYPDKESEVGGAGLERFYRKSTDFLIKKCIISVLCVIVLVLSVILVMQGDVVESDPFHPNGSEINVTPNLSVPFTTNTEAVYVIWREYISFESLCIVLGILGTFILIILQCITVTEVLRVQNKLMNQNAEQQQQQPRTVEPEPEPEHEHRQKLENSLCIVSFSKDNVQSCHLPLMKSSMDLLMDVNLQIKRLVITEPDKLNTIPPSKVFLVFVDFNEKNEILEPHLPKNTNLCIKRETVRSLLDSFALVILVYCLDNSSKKLDVGDRFAHKLLKKVRSVKELEELDNEHRFYSVYKEFNSFQLENLEQTIRKYL